MIRVQREVAAFDEVSEVADRAVSGQQLTVEGRPLALLSFESCAKECEGFPSSWSTLFEYASDGYF